MKLIILIIFLFYDGLSIKAQDWNAWKDVQDGADNKVQFSYKVVNSINRAGNVLYYRLKNGYNRDVCGAIYLSYIKLDGSSQYTYWSADIKAGEIKEGNYMNLYDVESVKGITSTKIKYCDGTQFTASDTKPSSYSFAVCDDKLPMSSHGPTGWCGPKRTVYTEAQEDAKSHNEKYHHQATVCTGDCPTCNGL